MSRGLASAGASVDLGCYEDVAVEEIAAAVNDLLEDASQRRTMSQVGRGLVDGRGCERVLEEALLC